MMTCPSRRQLAGLLNETLGDDELSDVVLHLESCPACQGVLEALTDGGLARGRDRPRPTTAALFVKRPLAFARNSTSSPGWPTS